MIFPSLFFFFSKLTNGRYNNASVHVEQLFDPHRSASYKVAVLQMDNGVNKATRSRRILKGYRKHGCHHTWVKI